IEVGTRSERVYFITPLAAAEAEGVTMEEVNSMIMLLISKYPQFAAFEDKILVSIADEQGPITPTRMIEIFDTFKIVNVSTK
ncbi:hypothetical protein ACFL1R_13440, partial [Candidatus Latescibacterota bacterium]